MPDHPVRHDDGPRRGPVKGRGILHAELAGVVAALGHGDLLVIGDAGLPVPEGVRVIDLALTPGVPGFQATVRALLSELVVERGFANAEAPGAAPDMARALEDEWPDGVPLERIDHAALKRMTATARAIIRTGEFTPYANLVLVAGVPF